MELQDLISEIKAQDNYENIGMIACHNGVVRISSRDGRRVEGLRVQVDGQALEKVLQEMRRRPGIVQIAVHLNEGYREVGSDVMLVAVAGDIRENVFPVLEETVERLKQEVIEKEEFFVD